MRLLNTTRIVAPAASMAGALGSVGFMYHSNQFNGIGLWFALFAALVLSPFAALLVAHMISKNWSVPARTTILVAMLILAAGSLAVYGNAAWKPQDATATPFLLVPLASWLLLSIVIPAAALKSGGPSRRRSVIWLMKAVVTAATLSCTGIIAVLVLLWFDYNRDTALPAPTGPFAVGRATYAWTDTNHADPMAPQPGIKRELVAWIWYPTEPGQSSQALDYLPNPWRTFTEQKWGITRFLTRDLYRVRGHSLGKTDLSPRQHSYPVVLTTGGPSFTSLAEDLASHGYVVASFDAAYRSGDVVLPDGKVIARVPQNDMDEASPSEFEHLANRLAEAGSADTSFAVDELERLNAADPSGKFVGRLDMQRVGAFGHSLRGAVALQFCHDDPRCKACIDVDGLPWGSAAREGIAQPLLLLMSDHAADPDDQEARLAKANFGSLINRLSGDRWLKITIRGAGHYMFSDDAILRSPLLMRALHTFGLVGIDGHRQIAVTEHYMGTFFDVYLKGSPGTELNAQPEYPEVEYAH